MIPLNLCCIYIKSSTHIFSDIFNKYVKLFITESPDNTDHLDGLPELLEFSEIAAPHECSNDGERHVRFPQEAVLLHRL